MLREVSSRIKLFLLIHIRQTAEYTVNNEEGDSDVYEITLGETSTAPFYGESVTIAYNPNNPEEAKAETSLGVSDMAYYVWIPVGFGVFLLVLAVYIPVAHKKRGDAIAQLVKNGTKIQGYVSDVRMFATSGVKNIRPCARL